MFRARIVTLVTRAVALLALPKLCSLIYVFPACHCVPKNYVENYITETECTNFLPHIRNASLHLHLRETKFERGRGIAGRSKLRHRQCHVVAYRQ